MKRICKYLTIPTSFFDTPDISVLSKWCLIALDSVYDGGQGVAIGVQGLSSLTNLPSKTVKECLNELYERGAVEVIVCDGQKFWKPLMYRESYPKSGKKVVIGDKPTDASPLPYDEIADKWAEICVTLPKITRWSPQRKNKLRSALKQAGLSIEDLYKVFRIIACTPFLSGASNQFSAHFDWVISKSVTLQKIYEGFYSKSYQEKRDYERIMNGGEVNNKQSVTEDFYR